MTSDTPVVLTLCDYYLPGYRAGGPIKSVSNLVDGLGDRIRFRVVTRNHDFRSSAPYPDVEPLKWQVVGKGHVYYVPTGRATARWIRNLLTTEHFDILYLNSMFSPLFTTLPLALRKYGVQQNRRVVLAPRGNLSRGSMNKKARKKSAFLRLTKAIGLYRDIIWQASSPYEADDIRRVIGPSEMIRVAPNICDPLPAEPLGRCGKLQGCLRIIFLARISEEKNLLGAIHALRGLEGVVAFDIFGPIDDYSYWTKCLNAAQSLPRNVTVRHLGAVERHKIPETISGYDLLFLPSYGENFGHAIFEALSVGCPVVISDRTPWRGLAARSAGWELPLEETNRFTAVLTDCLAMGPACFDTLRKGALAYAAEHRSESDAVESNRLLFTSTL